MFAPHDTLFRFTFTHKAHCVCWVRSIVPPEIRAVIAWDTLAPASERMPGLRVRPHLADAVFVAQRLDQRGDVLLLLEHKSHPDPGLEDQLLRYAVHLRHTSARSAAHRPSVLTVVLRHGRPERPPAVVALDVLAPMQPRIRYIEHDLTAGFDPGPHGDLTDLASMTLQCLATLPGLAPTAVLQFFAARQQTLRAIDRGEALGSAPPFGDDAIAAIGWYALAVTEVPQDDLAAVFCSILQRQDIPIMSTLERLYEEARASGLAAGHAAGQAEGHIQGRAATLLRILKQRFPDAIDRCASRVSQASPDDLDRWTDRVLVAVTLDDVFGS